VFFPLLKKAAAAGDGGGLSCTRAAIISFTSSLSSIADSWGGMYAYRTSKVPLDFDLPAFLSAGLNDEHISNSSRNDLFQCFDPVGRVT